MDHLTEDKRSWNMSRIKGKNTKPELQIRSILHKLGYRFNINGKIGKKYSLNGRLIGKPDIILPKYRSVIFVHGCFWHQHKGCNRASIPKSNQEYWIEKLNRNVQRDLNNNIKLKKEGWRTLTIWECNLNDKNSIKKKILNFINF